MGWVSLLGNILEEYLRQTANYETEFLWLIEETGEALFRLVCFFF